MISRIAVAMIALTVSLTTIVDTAAADPAAGMVPAGSPASAHHSQSPLGATGRTDGINVSARTVRTHDGTVRSGITFVDTRDVAAVKLQTSGSSGAPSVNVTNLYCINTWHTIAGGGSNSNWKPNSNTRIVANGNINVDPWNQWFLPCWRSGWLVQEFAFLSNATSGFVSYLITLNLYANVSQTADDIVVDNHTRFKICYYDGNWTYLKPPDTGAPIAYRDPATANVYLAEGSLNGNMLFKYTPSSLGSYADWC